MKVLLSAIVSCAVCLYLQGGLSTDSCSACHSSALQDLETSRPKFQEPLLVEFLNKSLEDPEPYCQWANQCRKTEGVDYPKTFAQLLVELQIKTIVRSLACSMTMGTRPCDHCIRIFTTYGTHLYQMAGNPTSIYDHFNEKVCSLARTDELCSQLVRDFTPHYIEEIHKQFNNTRETCVKAYWCRSM